jgi:hypothetical protein
MNNKIKSLEVQLEKLLATEVQLKNELENLSQNYDKQIREIWSSMLSFALLDTDTLRNDYSNGINVYRNYTFTDSKGNSDVRSKEIFHMYVGGQDKPKIVLNTYSTQVDSDFELERLMTVGQVAGFVRTHQDLILQEIAIPRPWNSEVGKKLNDISSEIRLVKNSIQDEKMNYAIDKVLSGGIEFEEKEGYSLPSLPIRFDYTLTRVSSIKVEKRSTSGKTCNILVECSYTSWSGEKVVEKLSYEKVKFENIRNVIRYNMNLVK